MDSHGNEFWVKVKDNEIYRIIYPCKNEKVCWSKTDIVPEVEQGLDVDYKVTENACENDSIAYPLFKKIKQCITSKDYAADATWIVSLALTEDNKLWIWQQPWESPYNVLFEMYLSTICGAIAGVLIGVLWAWKIK